MAKDKSTENKYSLKVQANSEDRALTISEWPAQDYLEFINGQVIAAKGFFRAGFQRAVLEKGQKVPNFMLRNAGIDPASFWMEIESIKAEMAKDG